ncbi:MAG: TIGR03751 family conjugal transfer lipoprotein [Acidiferrobacterales bacterium]|nr:TIGR03751 family conjugal transfer lipoprotein [Acidiferrobacterales bacterium]
MKYRHRTLVTVGLISLILSVISCSKLFPGSSPIPDNASTIEEIYDQHEMSAQSGWQLQHPIPDGPSHLDGYARDVYDELSVRFPRLPNPTIIMYIFPHLSLEKTPVPGYSTMFPMYETVEYALPGEI